MKRKLLAARLDLADKISEIASRRGTLYDYVNDVLEQAIRAEGLGLTIKDVLDDMWLIKMARDAGFIMAPEKIIYDLTESAYKRVSKEKMVNIWFETGQWYGRYYDSPAKFANAVRKYFWDISEFKVSQEGKFVDLTCLSSKFSAVYTELFSKFLEGALISLGYNLEKSEVSKGIISMRFVMSKGM